jgi:hypothetical protein
MTILSPSWNRAGKGNKKLTFQQTHLFNFSFDKNFTFMLATICKTANRLISVERCSICNFAVVLGLNPDCTERIGDSNRFP